MFRRQAWVLSSLFGLFLLALSIVPSAAMAAESKPQLAPVQVFDVKEGKVTRTLPNNAQFQAAANEMLKSINELAPELQPDNKCGFVYRIPLEKPASIQFQQLNFQAEELFLFHCLGKQPILLVFDAERHPYLFHFTAKIEPFLQLVSK